jgi:hypothetical protein
LKAVDNQKIPIYIMAIAQLQAHGKAPDRRCKSCG